MTLPSIESYSQAEVAETCKFSSALSTALRRSQDDGQKSVSTLRYRVWSEAVLATYFNRASARDICRIWSETADQILREVASELGAPEDLALFAFGKLGSRELNLSSDVDVVLVGRHEDPEHLVFLRKFQNRLSVADENGFLFRVDFDLRPGGKLGPLVPTIEQFTDFYGNYGETWERLAFIRLRPIWGNAVVIGAITDFTKRFVFRKHLDFSLLNDLKSLRAKVHEHYWQRSTEKQVDLKLGIGGIRDLELFTHALQVVHGGKDHRLHAGETTPALESFERYKILPTGDVQFLKNFYWRLRSLENSVQAIDDRQTHILRLDQQLPEYLTEFKSTLSQDLTECDRIVSDLLGKISASPHRLPESLELQKSWLLSLHFSQDEIDEIWPQILAVPIFSRNRERDLEIRNRFLFQFIQKMGAAVGEVGTDSSGRASNGLSILKEFLLASKAKASFFSMLLSNQQLLEMLVHLFSSSPYLSKIICARPELLDSLVMRNIEEVDLDSVEMDSFLDSLAERRMLTEILSGAELMRGNSLTNMAKNLTETADQICTQLLQKVSLELGAQPPAILALGKWGGQELGLRSDLDCIFVTEQAPTEMDHKLIRRFINRLTETHRGGSLYTIDTRLNMSGAGGVLITSKVDLEDYLSHRALCWERQAYLRGRWIYQDKNHFENKSISQFCISKRLDKHELVELERIRLELLKNAKGELDLKYAEGGLVDTEFAVQIAVLSHGISISKTSTYDMIYALRAVDSAWEFHAEKLIANYDLMRLVEQLKKLFSDEAGSSMATDRTYTVSIYKRLQMTAEIFHHTLHAAFATQLEILKKLDPRRAQSY